MNRKAIALSVACALVFTTAASFAAQKKTQKTTAEPHLMWTKAEYAKFRAWAAKQPKRSVAELDKIDETALSDSLNNLRDQITGGARYENHRVVQENAYPGVQTPDQLDALLTQLNDHYSELKPDAQWVAAQLLPLRIYRGIFARLIPLLKNAKFAHSMVAAGLRLGATGITTYLPASQWKVAIDYMSQPYEGMQYTITNEDQLVQFLENDVYPAMADTISKLNALKFEKQGVYFDNKILTVMGDYPLSDRDRFVLIGEPERYALIGALNFTASALASSCAYNMHGLMEAIKEMSNLFGYDVSKSTMGQFFGGTDPGIDGVSAKQRTQKLMSIHDRYNLFKKAPDGDAWMSRSYINLVNGVMATRASWDLLKTPHGENSRFVLNPLAFNAYERFIEASMDTLEQLLNLQGKYPDGWVPVQSAVSSKDSMRVNITAFFQNPPPDMAAFFPTEFNGNAYERTFAFRDGQTAPWHDYLSESPTGWNYSAYQPYFRTVNNADDVRTAARVFAQAWGGWLVGIPFSFLVF